MRVVITIKTKGNEPGELIENLCSVEHLQIYKLGMRPAGSWFQKDKIPF